MGNFFGRQKVQGHRSVTLLGNSSVMKSTACPVKYPMYVMPVQCFLAMNIEQDWDGAVPCHQQLLKKGQLVKWSLDQGLGSVAFVSHQWLGWSHADADFKQLSVLQRVLQRIHDGDITRVSPEWIEEITFSDSPSLRSVDQDALLELVTTGYIWFDYWSVPQTVGYQFDAGTELMDAVESIPAYVEMCAHFIVLCPSLEHKDSRDGDCAAVNDYASWSRRGWCRAEVCARLLARSAGPLIKIDSAEGVPVLVGAFHSWFSASGFGEYTCCERGHIFSRLDAATGQTVTVNVECDKAKVAGIVHTLVDTRVASLRGDLGRVAGDKHKLVKLLFELRWMQSIRQHVLRGLQSEEELALAAQSRGGPAALARFLREYHFEVDQPNGSPEDLRSGWTPLRYAVLANEVQVARELLARGAEVDAPLAADHPEVFAVRGRTILSTAASFCSGNEVIELLLDHGADAMAADANKCRCSELAALGENDGALEVLLRRAPSLLEVRNIFNYTPLIMAVVVNNGTRSGACAELLLAHGARADEATCQGAGRNVVVEAAYAVRGHSKVLELLLRHPRCSVSVNARTRWSDFNLVVKLVYLYAHLRHWLNRQWWCRQQSSSLVAHFASIAPGMTALMMAASVGSVPNLRVLLAAGADPTIRDGKGRTALDIARVFGPFELAMRVLLDAELAWRPRLRDGASEGAERQQH